MKLLGKKAEGNTEELIAQLMELPSGFSVRAPEDISDAGVSRGESSQLHARLRAATIASPDSNPMRHNLKPAAPNAHRVEGSEVGFSNFDPIGTDNVHDCVCVILRNPETGRTALAHIGGDATPESLQSIWNGLGYTSGTLEMRMFGGRHLPDGSETGQSNPYLVQNNQIARWNVEKVVEFFQDKPVDVLSANILTANQPAVVVVDPKSRGFELTENVPGRPNPEAALTNALGVLHMEGYLSADKNGVRPLHTAFDLTREYGQDETPTRNPLLLTGEEVKKIRDQFLNKNPAEITAYMQKNHRTGLMLEQALERAGALSTAYASSFAPLQGEIDIASAASKEHVRQEAYAKALYIGEHAQEANLAATSEIRAVREQNPMEILVQKYRDFSASLPSAACQIDAHPSGISMRPAGPDQLHQL